MPTKSQWEYVMITYCINNELRSYWSDLLCNEDVFFRLDSVYLFGHCPNDRQELSGQVHCLRRNIAWYQNPLYNQNRAEVISSPFLNNTIRIGAPFDQFC